MEIKRTSVAIILFFFVTVSCTNNTDKIQISKNKQKRDQSWEINLTNGDTICIVDANGLKQGLWIERNNDKKPSTRDIDTVTYKDGVAVKQK